MAKSKDRDALSPDYKAGFEAGRRAAAGLAPVADLPGPPDSLRASNATAALVALTGRSFRHIRFVSEDAGKTVHCKLGVATEAYPWHYLYYRADNYALPHVYLPGLLDKAYAFEEGRLKPSPDRHG